MAKKFNKAIEQAFGLDTEEANNLPAEVHEAENLPAEYVEPTGDEMEDDYQLVRKNLKELAETAQEIIDEYHVVAEDIETPRAYEVLGNMIKNAAEINEKLLTAGVTVKKTRAESSKGPEVVNNTLVMTSEEVQRQLMNRNKNNG